MTRKEIENLLEKINPATCDYEEWLEVGMILKHEGFTARDWEAWSKRDPDRFHGGECFKKWATFNGSSTPVTLGSLFEIAKRQGVFPMPAEDGALSWDDEISDEMIVVDKNWVEDVKPEEPSDETWDPIGEIIQYLNLLFLPNEYVSYTFRSYLDEDGKYKPTGAVTGRTQEEIIKKLEKYRHLPPSEAIENAMGSYDEKAGAWICFNPVDGRGRMDKNITAFRYALIESDNITLGQQISILKQMELPIQAMVYSGNKSVHALVRIDAQDKDEYRKRVNYLYKVCEKNGLILDKQNRNPSRLSRIPGVIRGNKKQYLIEGKSGKESFEEWQDWIEEVNDDLGYPELPPADNKPPALAPELIEGILRTGHKMCIAGPSKAGKSFLLLELAIAFTQGSPWLGRKTKRSKVLYVNLELDAHSLWHRIWDILQTKGKTYEDLQGLLEVWNLRGKATPMDKLSGKLIRRAEEKEYDIIIIDPIYKVLTGDENNARDMAIFTNQFDKIATTLKSAVIYCHHHSKGYQGQKKSMDRASGSGVFARDPDALLDMSPIDIPEDEAEKYGIDSPDVTAWRLEGTLREFANFRPIDIYFKYPVHEVDTEGRLQGLLVESEKPYWMRGTEKAKKARQNKADKDFESFEFQFANYTSFHHAESMPLKAMADCIEKNEKTIRAWVKNDDRYSNYCINNSKIFLKEEGKKAEKNDSRKSQ